MAITGGYVNDLHLMQGTTDDLDANGKPKVTETSENTFFLVEDSGDVFYFSGGEWAEADDAVAGIVAALLNKGALPAVTSTDNGKVLTVANGAWSAETASAGSVTAAAVAQAIGDMTSAQTATVVSDLGVQSNPTRTTVSGSTPSITAADNTIYTCGEVSSITVTAAANIDFTVIFTSGSTAATLTMDQNITMPDSFSVETNTRYEINVSNGYAVVAGWAVSA